MLFRSRNDTSGSGTTSQSGRSSAFPKRLGQAATDPTLAVTDSATLATYLTSFCGSGGGGGNASGEADGSTASASSYGLGGIGGGGAGSVGIVSPGGVTISGRIEARGGDGATPGIATYVGSAPLAHSGGGGGSGGTVYIASNTVSIASPASDGTGGATIDLRGGLGGGRRSQHLTLGLTNYPEYMPSGAFGGSGGFGRLVVDYTTSVNSGATVVNRWGMEQTTIDSTSNTYKTLAGTARFYCPGVVPSGTTARSTWYDLRSLSPSVTSFAAGTVTNATVTLRIEGAQSLPNTVGSGTGSPDPANTSGLFEPTGNPLMTGWRWLRWDATFTRTSGATDNPPNIDNLKATWTSDL